MMMYSNQWVAGEVQKPFDIDTPLGRLAVGGVG
jgi:hypothetical protein